ncbi:MAG: peptide chain release factor N(5)-glutamine methyltransferase [Rubrivivax sp.]
MKTVAEALAAAARRGLPRLDAQLLLAHRLGRSRTWLLAHDETALAPADAAWFEAAVAQRLDEVPLAYLTGEREFRGLPLAVGPGVLVPRPETEGLVEWALECLQGLPAPRVADLGTGSGAIALAIASACPAARVVAVDRSEAALAVARANGRRLGLAVDWRAGDWWAPLQGETFDLVVSNPPYIAAGDPHLPALRHEPASALVAGADGLDDLRRIVAGAPARLSPGGWLLLEHGHDQGAAVRALLQGHGLEQAVTRVDLAGLDRCSGARRIA